MTPLQLPQQRTRLPLFIQVVLAATVGAAVGAAARSLGFADAIHIGAAGTVLIKLLKILATPLIFLAVLETAIHLTLPARKAALFLVIAGVNALVAIAIGFGVARVSGAGIGAFGDLHLSRAPVEGGLPPEPLFGLSLPASIVEPFANGSIVAVVALALLTGLALRAVRSSEPEGVSVIEQAIRAALSAVTRALRWCVTLIPLAVFAVIAQTVAAIGFVLVDDLAAFLTIMIVGMALHVLVYYPLLIAFIGRRSPRDFFRGAADAVATALSSGSSLATLPVTLRCLSRLGVSSSSARLSTCVGTNLNHDGIILYEGAAAVFVAQAIGLPLGPSEHVAIAVAAVAAGIGIAGVPEAGLVTLPLVLAAAGVPAPAIAALVPVLLTVDWIIGRFRAATNVASDMVVAVVLDRLSPTGEEGGQ